MITLIKYECHKILKRKSTRLTLSMLTLLVLISNIGTLIGPATSSSTSRYNALQTDRNYASKVSGMALDTPMMVQVQSAFKKIPYQGETHYRDTQEYADYGQAYQVQASLMRLIFTEGLNRHIGPQEIANLPPEVFDDFYSFLHTSNREMIHRSTLNARSKDKLLAYDRALKTPFVMTYSQAYDRFLTVLYSNSIFILLGIAICLAPVFSGEYATKTAPLLLASKYGKTKLPLAKLASGIIFGLTTALGLIGLSFVEIMVLWGHEGGHGPYQLLRPFIPYNLTLLSVSLIMVASVLAAVLVTVSLTLYLSSRFKTPFWVIVITGIFLMAPMFYSIPHKQLLAYQINSLLPANMIDAHQVISIYMYEISKLSIEPYIFKPLFSLGMACLLMPFTYKAFKNHQTL